MNSSTATIASAGDEIIQAAKSGNIQMFRDEYRQRHDQVRYLVRRENLLHVTAELGQAEIVQEIIQNGLCPANAQHPVTKQTPLHCACIMGDCEVIRIILHHLKTVFAEAVAAADKNGEMRPLQEDFLSIQDRNGYTPAHICGQQGDLEPMRLIVETGIRLDVADKNGLTAAHWATKRSHLAILQFLFNKASVNFEQPDRQGRTLLHYAAINNEGLDCLKCLIKRGCDLVIRDNRGATPIHLAAEQNCLANLKFLHSAQAVPLDIRQNDGFTPAHLAAINGAGEALHYLAENGADLMAVDNNGNTIGHLAMWRGHSKCMYCFLRHIPAHVLKSLEDNGIQDILINLRNKTENENIIETSKRFGHYNALQDAISGTIKCSLCSFEENRSEWAKLRQIAPVLEQVNKSSSQIYTSPLGNYKSAMHKNQKHFQRNQVEKQKRFDETLKTSTFTRKSSNAVTAPTTADENGQRSSITLNEKSSFPRCHNLLTKFYGEYTSKSLPKT